MKLGHNLLAGLANSLCSTLIGLAVVPLYLRYIGIEGYGLVGFFATIQAALSLLDMGMSPAINREVASRSADGNLAEAGKLLHTLAVVYWSVALLLAVLIAASAPWIAAYWLQSKKLSLDTIQHAVILMGILVACRWPITLYQGVLIGAERLVTLTVINISMTALGAFGTLFILAFISPSIEVFFVCQAAAGLLYAATIRWRAWRIVGRTPGSRFDVIELKRIWRFSAGMSGVAISTVMLMQVDKIVLSKLLSLSEFGNYMVAVALANGLRLLLTPVFNVLYPRLTALVVKKDHGEMIFLYRAGTCFLAATLFPIAMAAVVTSKDLLFLWTGNIDLANRTAPILSFLLLGTAMNGVMIFPYALQLAYGQTKLPLTISYTLLAVYAPMTFALVVRHGAMGGAVGWAAFNLMYLFFGTWITHRRLLKGVGVAWLTRDVLLPLLISVGVILLGGKLLYVDGSQWTNVIMSATLALLTMSSIAALLQGKAMRDAWAARRVKLRT